MGEGVNNVNPFFEAKKSPALGEAGRGSLG